MKNNNELSSVEIIKNVVNSYNERMQEIDSDSNITEEKKNELKNNIARATMSTINAIIIKDMK